MLTKSLIDPMNEIKEVIDGCDAGIDTTTFEGKKQMVMNFFHQLDQWRSDWAKAYQKALDVNPDLSPREFDTTRNRLNQVA